MSVTLSRRTFLASSASALAVVAAPPTPIRLSLDREASKVRVSPGRMAFHYGQQWAKPFLYPLITPAGLAVSRGYPIEKRDGNETTDHPWHRGLWIGHGDINGVDFWRELKPENTGLIRIQGEPKIRRDSFTAEFDLLPPNVTTPIGTLTQQWTFASNPLGIRIDVRFTYHAGAGKPLHFGDTDDGGFGVRLRDEFRQDRGAALRNDTGATGTKALWGKPARWIDYSASVDGRAAGVAIFDHPANLRYPTAWHARPYGLNAANPFANRSFNGKDAPSGEYEIPAGQKLTLAYRVLIHDGMGESLALDTEAPR